MMPRKMLSDDGCDLDGLLTMPISSRNKMKIYELGANARFGCSKAVWPDYIRVLVDAPND